MERHFALPIAIAAALHAGLLFGFRSGPVKEIAPPIRVGSIDPLPPVVEIVDLPKDSDESGPATAKERTARPSSPEPPPPVTWTGPTMERPPYEAGATPGPMTTVPFVTPRVGGGGPGDGPGILAAAQLDRPPHARVRVSPVYPPAAKRDGRTGEVVVEFVVDEGGRVVTPTVVRSNDPVFDAATLAAVAKWRFEPGTRHGRAVRFRMMVPVVFNLDE